jgi:hypothetical protein
VLTADGGAVRLGFADSPDWFGPGRFAGPAEGVEHTVEEEDEWIVFRLEAASALRGFATGEFARPSLVWPWFDPAARTEGGIPTGSRGFGFQYTEFCWPVHCDESLSAWHVFPFRPSIVEPLGVVAPDGRCILLAPFNGFHDQVIAVSDGIACGWHGDLDAVEAGFATEVVALAGRSPRACLDRYGALLRDLAGTSRPARDTDTLGRCLSYWTDNGSAYWYRTEPDLDTNETLRATVDDLRARDIPVHAVQLDSWWYPHEVVRPFNTDAWEVPPTGLATWEARRDVLPDGVRALRAELGDPPLVTHCRHVSSSSPYVDQFDCWIDGDRAHPTTGALYERWLDQAQAWGVETFEHDWLIESFLGVRGLREVPGRARDWQEALDDAAAARGITLQWCMASPADFLQSTTLRALTSIRTSGDHGYLLGPGELWAWFLLVNAFARGLDLRPYKDVFFSDRDDPAHYSEVESVLAALSSGPVGIGDRLGRADRDIVMRTCRADGVLVRPDVAIAATGDAFFEHPAARPVPLVADAWTDHPAGRWLYALALNVCRQAERLEQTVSVPARGDHICWNWRTGHAAPLAEGARWPISLDPLDWDYRVLAPVLPNALAVVGDPTRYATAGDTRIAGVEADDEHVRFTVLGAGETVSVAGWSGRGAPTARAWTTDGWRTLDVTWHEPVWRIDVAVPDPGWVAVELS